MAIVPIISTLCDDIFRCLENGHYDLFQCGGDECFCTDCAGLKIDDFEVFLRGDHEESQCACAREAVGCLFAMSMLVVLLHLEHLRIKSRGGKKEVLNLIESTIHSTHSTKSSNLLLKLSLKTRFSIAK